MNAIIPENLKRLADFCPEPLYLVGGSVRDYLCGFPVGADADWDLCSPATEDEFLRAAERAGCTVRSVYRNTGTVKLTAPDGAGYEFTRFRSDKYVRGVHAPSEITFTSDMGVDARRRDFTCNAVYYDVARERFVDPLGGREDIAKRKLRTVAPAKRVFGEDGLRLMRLCRFAAQLGFSPDEECLFGAKEHAALVQDVVPERVFTELTHVLLADGKHGLSDGPYRGLALLRETGVLPSVLPELALGQGMAQRSDFHAYDVLEHTFRCVRYAPREIRYAALLHDAGKPFCMKRDGNFHAHPAEGARIAREILSRLKAPNRLTEETEKLVLLHMVDFDCRMRESKVRLTIAENASLLPRLLALKQADFSACKDDLSPAPTVVKWKRILSEMRAENAPTTVAELDVNGAELIALGVLPRRTGEALHELLRFAALDGTRNRKHVLLARAKKFFTEVSS
ncbi:MAG: CCA tRNA nucleotidyltransferase [Candidatus Gallimonas sp.]